MIVYNTTYTMPEADARNFVIWVNESLLPLAARGDMLARPRLLRVLSHRDQDSECFSLQFETDSTATLHRWHAQHGQQASQDLQRLFGGRVLGFSTILEPVEA